MPLLSSSTARPHDRLAHLIHDDIYDDYSNLSFDRLELWKINEGLAEHEFVILHMTADSPGPKHYRVERRPTEGANINSKVRGCEAKDTITAGLNQSGSPPVFLEANKKIALNFNRAELKPDLYTVFDICNAIRMDPESEHYTLTEFNCYFFARTLTQLIARHFILSQYCHIHKPRNDFSSLSGSEIDAILSEATNSGSKELRRCITIWFQESNGFYPEGYEEFRQYIIDMNKRHCNRVSRMGRNGDEVYKSWNKKAEDMWRHVCSDPTPADEDEEDAYDEEKEEKWPRRRSNPTMAQFSSGSGTRSNYRRQPPPPARADYSYQQSYDSVPGRRVANPTYTTVTRRGRSNPVPNNYGYATTFRY